MKLAIPLDACMTACTLAHTMIGALLSGSTGHAHNVNGIANVVAHLQIVCGWRLHYRVF